MTISSTLKRLIDTDAEVEGSSFCQQIIGQRAKEGLVASAPIFPDVRTLRMADIQHSQPEGFIGGFPCQVRA